MEHQRTPLEDVLYRFGSAAYVRAWAELRVNGELSDAAVTADAFAGGDIIGAQQTALRSEAVLEKATRPLGASYRPRRRPLELDSSVERRSPRPQPTAPSAEVFEDELINRTLQCVEPTRRTQITDDVNIHMTARRGMLSALDDLSSSEATRIRCLAGLAVHLATYRTTDGLPTFYNPALLTVCKRLEVDIEDAEQHLDAVTTTATKLLAATSAALRDFDVTRQDVRRACDAQLLTEETADAAAATPAATATADAPAGDLTEAVVGNAAPAVMLEALLRDLPAPVLAVNPLAESCSTTGDLMGVPATRHAFVTHIAMGVARTIDLYRKRRPKAAQGNDGASPFELTTDSVMHFLHAFVFPMLCEDPESSDVLLGRAASPSFVASVALRDVNGDEFDAIIPTALCCDAATTTPKASREGVWALTTPLAAVFESLLMVAKGFDRAALLFSDRTALTHLLQRTDLHHTSWQTAALKELGNVVEGCGPILTLPKRFFALVDRIAAARDHGLTRHILTLTMRAQGRRFFGPRENRPSLLRDCGDQPPESDAAYVFLRHVQDVCVPDDKSGLVAMMVLPGQGTLRFVALPTILTEYAP